MSIWGRLFGVEKNRNYELGIRFFNEGRYEEAVEALEKAIAEVGRNDPDHALGMFYAAEAHFHCGNSLFEEGRFEKALAHFEKAARENPGYPDLYYRMGVIRHRLGDADAAADSLGRAIELNPQYFEAVCYLGIVLFESGKREEADRFFEQAREIGARSPVPISKFLSAHLASGDTDIPPLASLRRMVVPADGQFGDLMRTGIESYNTGDYARSAEAFREAALLHPDYADVRFKLGLSLLRDGRHDEAATEFEEALTINPRYTEARFYLGVTFLDRRMYREALPCFDRAAGEKPDYADLQCYLGATLYYLGELDRAGRTLERAIELAPGYTKAKYYYGLLLYTAGDRGRAVTYLSEGIRGGERKESAGLSLALVHLREGNLEEAMAVLREILEAGAGSADVLYFLGEIHLRTKRQDEAAEFYERALEANPGFVRAREKLAFIHMRRGDFDRAEAVLAAAGGEYADLCKIMGDIKFYKGDLEEAERCYRRSLAVNTEYGEASLSLALTLRQRGKQDEADELLRRLVDLDPANVVARSLLGRGPLDLEPS